MAVYKFSKKENKTKSANVSRIIGIVLMVVCTLCFLSLLTSLVGFMRYFLLGTFGLFAYPMFLTLFVVGLALINKRKYVMPIKYVIFLALSIIFLLGIIQMIIVGGKAGLSYGDYLALNYNKQFTAGGAIIGFISGSMLYTIGEVGTYLALSIGFVVFAGLTSECLYRFIKNENKVAPVKLQIKEKKAHENKIVNPLEIEDKKSKEPVKEESVVFAGNLQEEITREQEALSKLGLAKGKRIENKTQIAPSSPKNEPKKEITNRREYILSPPKVDIKEYFSRNEDELSRLAKKVQDEPSKKIEINENINALKQESIRPSKFLHEDMPEYSSFEAPKKPNIEQVRQDFFVPQEKQVFAKEEPVSILNKIFDETEEKVDTFEKPKKKFVQIDMEISKPPIRPQKDNYNKPPFELLTTESMDLSMLNEDVVEKRVLLENALETFGIPAKVIGVVVGPAVTRYELEMPPGISVKKVLSHSDDIALALASNGDIRIEAPIPGKSAVGIEVPNNSIATVGLKDIIYSKEFQESKAPLTVALGKDIAGQVRLCNLQKMPHLLVAGSTGSGKSVCLNSILISLIYKTSPKDLRLILVDPKRVEFAMYEGLPHLMTPFIVTESGKAINALNWAITEMEHRFQMLQDTKTRNIDEYNAIAKVISGEVERMPFIVIVVDELADLMMTSKKEVEEKIMRLAQKARAAGIHLILATQRPSVDVITGTIKANLSSRIAFAVTSFADSSTILGQGGADKLLGKGDMLYAPSDASEPKRIQGCYVTGQEVDNIVEYVKEHNQTEFDKAVQDAINCPGRSASSLVDGAEETILDPLFPQALKLVIDNGQASITMIQRKFVVGYPRAARIIDQMEQANYISTSDGSKPRSVYITMEEYNELFNEGE